MTENKSKYAILGILNISPCTGYDIKKYCDTVISGIWHENFGHIYPTLKLLEQEELIKKIPEEKKSNKNLFQITPTGKQKLLSWLGEETKMQPVRSEFMLKFLFSDCLSKTDIVQMLENYKKKQEDELKKYLDYKEILEKNRSDLSQMRIFLLSATLERGILSARSSISWCEKNINCLTFL